MNESTVLIGIGIAILIGAASPGPSFLVVSRIAVSRSRLDGMLAALGMGIGGLGFALASLLGLTGLLLAVPSAYWALKIIGGIYLVYLGISTWRNARKPVLDPTSGNAVECSTPLSSFLISLSTQLSNPKALIIYSGVFATFHPTEPSIQFGIGVCSVVFVVESGWYAFVVLVLSSDRSRTIYLQYKSIVDRVAGSILGTLGLKLVFSAER